ncbi:MAG: hypothetical protein KAI47_06315, partial [Deltaproteobacteria bacterium]|nr:hypothetical protein [Deltaproteobacteria bacterium]
MSFFRLTHRGFLFAVILLWVGACRFDGSGIGGSDLSWDLFGDVSPDISVKFDLRSDLSREGRVDVPSLPIDGSSIDADGQSADIGAYEDASDTLAPDMLAPDTAPKICPPNKPYCKGGVRHVCNKSGTGPVPGQDTICDFICAATQCRYPSNIPVAVYKACTSAASKLTPAANATVQISEVSGTLRISCDPDCGDGTTKSIDAGPDGFCLSELTIPKGLEVTTVGEIDKPVTIFVVGAVHVAGTIALSGSSASASAAGGYGGPGGGAGGPRTSTVGDSGQGACPGEAGQRDGGSNDW